MSFVEEFRSAVKTTGLAVDPYKGLLAVGFQLVKQVRSVTLPEGCLSSSFFSVVLLVVGVRPFKLSPKTNMTMENQPFEYISPSSCHLSFFFFGGGG